MAEIRQMTPQKREKAGRAVLNLSGRDAGKGLGGSHHIKFVSQGGLPDNELAVGDLVIISTGKPNGKEPQGTVTEKTNFALTVAFTNKPPSYAYKKNLRLDLFANDITYQRMLEAIKTLKNNQKALDLLTEQLQNPVFEESEIPNGVNETLNDSQQFAVEQAFKARDFYLIHGPPGTGKTTTLVEAIIQHAGNQQKILATSDSNTAVDNLVEKLYSQGCKVIRLGNPARINQDLLAHSLDYLLQFEEGFKQAKSHWHKIDELKEQQKNHQPATGQNRRGLRDSQIKNLAKEGKTSRGIPPGKLKAMAKWLEIQDEISGLAEKAIELEESATQKLLADTEVVCATNATAGGNVLYGHHFDTVFIDEATQSIEPACLIPMVKGDKFVMAGDHKQLPPTVLNRQAQPYLQVTLFERLLEIYDETVETMLDVQYRMHNSIMAFPNEAFYEKKLKAHKSVAGHTLADFNLPLAHSAEKEEWLKKALAPEPVSVFIDTQHQYPESQLTRSFSYRNEQEAEIIKTITEKFLGAGYPAEKIGIISPYDDQVERIKSIMNKPERPEIKTVDGFQGREKEIILISFVRSNDQGKMGFLTDYRRLNVAITRARRKLIMVGDAFLLAQNEVYEQLLNRVFKVEMP